MEPTKPNKIETLKAQLKFLLDSATRNQEAQKLIRRGTFHGHLCSLVPRALEYLTYMERNINETIRVANEEMAKAKVEAKNETAPENA